MIGVKQKYVSPSIDFPRGKFSTNDDVAISPIKDLLDLDSIFDGVVTPHNVEASNTIIQKPSAISDVDLLSDIFTTVKPIEPKLTSNVAIRQDHTKVSNSASSQADVRAQVKAFQKDGLTITMDLMKDPTDLTRMNIFCKFFNYTPKNFERLIFQAAVPKYVIMEMKSASASSVPSNSLGDVTQIIKVDSIL